MVEQAANDTAATGPEAKPSQPKRFQSEIEFPYSDLESAVELAQKLHSKAGSSCNDTELAAWLDQSATGGTYRSRRSAARMFGLIDTSQGKITLTPLGHDIADAGKERAARAEAFLKPELYQAMYEQGRGHVLPPPPAIERQMEQLGVSPKQKERARQVFQKSAVYAGFIDPASGRFVKPGNGSPPREAEDGEKEKLSGGGNGGGSSGGEGLHLDPLLIELLRKVPKKDEGWEAAKRVRWFRTFAMNVSQIYDDDDKPVELEIKLAKDDA